MKTKKITWIVFVALLCIVLPFAYTLSPMSMDDIKKQPHFNAVVTQVQDSSILVLVDEGEDARKSSDLISVSLTAQWKHSMTDFSIGDHITVFYNGAIAESYPAQIHGVYAIVPVNEGPSS